MKWNQSRFRLLVRSLTPLLSSPAVYLVSIYGGYRIFGVRSFISLHEIGLQILLGYLFFLVARRVWLFLAAQALFVGSLNLLNCLKFAYFGGPVLASDVYSVGAVLQVARGAELVFLAAAPLALLLGLAINLELSRSRVAAALLLLAALIVVPTYAPGTVTRAVAAIFDWRGEWDNDYYYRRMGAGIFLLQDFARMRENTDSAPQRDEAAAAVAELRQTAAGPSGDAAFERRNVYMLVVESLWDPSRLVKAGYDRDPWDERFRELWQQGGESAVLSPVFGGSTSEAEFELICGHEVHYASGVVFMSAFTRAAKCLPAILAESGYQTVAAHPNRPSFWNRVSAYRRAGFSERLFGEAFDLTDLNGSYMSDSSLFDQVLTRVAARLENGQSPFLFYVLTISSHWPYTLNPSRPQLIGSTSEIDDARNYANSVHYTSKEVFEGVAQIRHLDPTGLIVVTSDHLPTLGRRSSAYLESDLLRDSSQTPAEVLLTSSLVPMIVIDGERGPIDVGTVSMFEVPSLIMRLLQAPLDEPMSLFTRKDGLHVRSTAEGEVFVLDPEERVEVCRPARQPSRRCIDSIRWLEQGRVVSNDLMRGRRHTARSATAGE